MKILCVVAEYNPLHEGHVYHLRQSAAWADYCIVIMSGDFCQRGAPTVLDKYTRARHAVSAGADLVVELPTLAAVHCAEQFAKGAMRLVNAIPAPIVLSFGSECGDVDTLSHTACLMQSAEVEARTHTLVAEGTAYPMARQTALAEVAATKGQRVADVSQPNNILGMEYLRYVREDAEVHTIRRTGDYHSLSAAPSSRYVRQCIADGTDYRAWVPEYVAHDLAHCTPAQSVLYLAAWRAHEKDYFADLLDASEGIHNRVWQCARDYPTYEAALEAACTKRYTRARIARLFTAGLIDLHQQDLSAMYASPIYYNVLAVRAECTHLLSLLGRAGEVVTTQKALREGTGAQQIDARAHETYRLMHACDVPQGMIVLPKK